jgi:flavin-dependent dehydrogenase
MANNRFDIAVIGGGPAGAATALLLSKGGYSVLLLEASNYDRYRVGETLHPSITKGLRDLGVADDLLQLGYRSAAGIISAWTQPQLETSDFMLGLQGLGWQVDRAVFDRVIAFAAASAGTSVLTQSHLVATPTWTGKAWLLKAKSEGGIFNFKCRFLVDATGRCGTPLLSYLSSRTVVDRLIGIAWTGKQDQQWPYALVESTSDGWFYSTSLPGSRATIAYMTDSDLYRDKSQQFPNVWWRELRRTEHTSKRFPDRCDWRALTIVSAATISRIEPAGESWCAVGDAAISFDPLSGLGVQQALDSAFQASDAILARMAGNKRALDCYRQWLNQCFSAYLVTRRAYYSHVKRWPSSRFWQRRAQTFPAVQSLA